jgi:hypothetical protein
MKVFSRALHRLCITAILTLLLSSRSFAQGEPFGLRMGLTVADLQGLTGAVADKDLPGIYRALRTPRPNAAFESYTFIVTPSTGLCKLWATGNTIDNDAYGTALHSEFDRLQEVLDQKYGPHKNFDYLNEGSIWREPREWMMALKQKERILTSYWGTLENTGKPPAPVSRVMLKASALDSSSGWLSLYYEFTNSEKCLDEFDRMKNSSL